MKQKADANDVFMGSRLGDGWTYTQLGGNCAEFKRDNLLVYRPNESGRSFVVYDRDGDWTSDESEDADYIAQLANERIERRKATLKARADLEAEARATPVADVPKILASQLMLEVSRIEMKLTQERAVEFLDALAKKVTDYRNQLAGSGRKS